MKSIVIEKDRPPEVLELKETEKPVLKKNGVMIRVKATSVNYGDLLARDLKAVTPRDFNMPLILWFFTKVYFGFKKPRIRILGSEFSGVVESVGKDVKTFKPGDPVFGYLGQSMGAYAEYICLPEKAVMTIKPVNVTWEEAAVSPYGAIMALSLLRNARVREGQNILIAGASGGIGSAAVQIAVHLGAKVTGVCNTPGVEYVKSLGADRVIDYSKEDFTRTGETFDLVFDILGRSSFSRCKKILKAKGVYIPVSFKTGKLLQMIATSLTGGKRVKCAIAPGSLHDLESVKELIEQKSIRPVIDRRFPLGQAAAAHRYAESGLKKGKVAITIP